MVTQFEEGFKEKKEKYKDKTSRQKYLKNEDYKEFKEAIFVSSRFSVHPRSLGRTSLIANRSPRRGHASDDHVYRERWMYPATIVNHQC